MRKLNIMKICKKILLISLVPFCLSGCSKGYISRKYDKYLKSYAYHRYSNNEQAPLYSTFTTEQPFDSIVNYFYNYNGTNYVSRFSGENTYSMSEIPVLAQTALFFKTNTNYPNFADVFGHSYQGYSYETPVEQLGVMNTSSSSFKTIFPNADREPNLAERVYRVRLYDKWFYRSEEDAIYNFDYGYYDNPSINAEFYILPDTYNKTAIDEYVGYNEESKTFYRFLAEENVIKKTIIQYQYNDPTYIRIFDCSYDKFKYYFYLEKKTTITNDFDFILTLETSELFGVGIQPGLYKIHSSHPIKYIPIGVYLDRNNTSAYALCLLINKDKTIKPEYNLVELKNNGRYGHQDSKIDSVYADGKKQYAEMNDKYILMEAGSLRFLDKQYCVYEKEYSTEVYAAGYDQSSYYGFKYLAKVGDSVYLYNESSENKGTIVIISRNKTDYRYGVDFIDKMNLLYKYNGVTYFRDTPIYSFNTSEPIYYFYSQNLTYGGGENHASINIYKQGSRYIGLLCK